MEDVLWGGYVKREKKKRKKKPNDEKKSCSLRWNFFNLEWLSDGKILRSDRLGSKPKVEKTKKRGASARVSAIGFLTRAKVPMFENAISGAWIESAPWSRKVQWKQTSCHRCLTTSDPFRPVFSPFPPFFSSLLSLSLSLSLFPLVSSSTSSQRYLLTYLLARSQGSLWLPFGPPPSRCRPISSSRV